MTVRSHPPRFLSIPKTKRQLSILLPGDSRMDSAYIRGQIPDQRLKWRIRSIAFHEFLSRELLQRFLMIEAVKPSMSCCLIPRLLLLGFSLMDRFLNSFRSHPGDRYYYRHSEVERESCCVVRPLSRKPLQDIVVR
ncbi:unnamed protein product [Periconia digitata]|uniref:Uncharacterized protein n=1 Tax=Periconia digitata TaxID=1303443 RepID=A0A9W4U437_9PLEO|nr:unnamed protein product [Periconia digitata]